MSNAELKQRIIELMSERNATGVAIDDAILGHLPEQHPMLNMLQIIAKLATQRDQLLASLKELLSSKAEPGMFAGVMAADNAAKLIKSIEDSKWAVTDHSPDAGKMVIQEGCQDPIAWGVVVDGKVWRVSLNQPIATGEHKDATFIPLYAAAPKLGGE